MNLTGIILVTFDKVLDNLKNMIENMNTIRAIAQGVQSLNSSRQQPIETDRLNPLNGESIPACFSQKLKHQMLKKLGILQDQQMKKKNGVNKMIYEY